MKNIKTIILLMVLCVPLCSYAQESKGLQWFNSKGIEYRIKAGFNLGGSSPLPLPAEIRAINKYDPGLNLSLEGSVIKWFDSSEWGMLVGVRFENKGMSTDATVKNYFLTMQAPGQGLLEGMWTGSVETTADNSYITIPLQAIYKANPRLDVKFGPYVSFLLDGGFTGYAYDGYLREGSPTGEKVIIEGEKAAYDFSDNIRGLDWGLSAGAEWKAYKHLIVFGDLNWGLSPIFESGFESVNFDMYNIYLNLGFGYVF